MKTEKNFSEVWASWEINEESGWNAELQTCQNKTSVQKHQGLSSAGVLRAEAEI